MIDALFDKETYTTTSLKNEIILFVKKIHSDSIIRIKMKNIANLTLLNTKFLNDIIPVTMNWQISGF
jgi:hypothetical protein